MKGVENFVIEDFVVILCYKCSNGIICNNPLKIRFRCQSHRSDHLCHESNKQLYGFFKHEMIYIENLISKVYKCVHCPKEKCLSIKVPILSSCTWKLIIWIFSCKINSWRRKNYPQLCCVACARNSMLPRKMKLLNISRINIGPKKKYSSF